MGRRGFGSIRRLPSKRYHSAVTVTHPPIEVTDVVTFDPSDVIDRVLAEHPTASLAAEVVGQGYR